MQRPLLHRMPRPGTVLLDTARPDEENRTSLLFADPAKVIRADRLCEVPDVLRHIDDAIQQGYYVAGYLSYEAGYHFESITPDTLPDEPLAWFGVYEQAREIAPQTVSAQLASSNGAPSVRHPEFGVERSAYLAAMRQIKHHIREGDVYQINYTGPLTFETPSDSVALYQALRRQQHVPYSAFLNLGSTQILSLSPELFFRREGNHIATRPMKGTVRRGRTLHEDRALRDWLEHDVKSRAENLMIVDLLRNDLSRCCTPGSVDVPALFTTEPYETVTQMTSTVTGELRDEITYQDLFAALFPCGSVTGAPKIRAMEIIRDLETAPRGVYCGSIGYIAPDQTAVFNVAIRTAVLQNEKGRMGIGSGIVWDSEPEAEYEECQLKGQFLTDLDGASAETNDDLRLIETMRWEGGDVALWDRHVRRLRDSAAYFGYPFDAERMREAVKQEAALLDRNEAYKIRLTLGPAGTFRVSSDPVNMFEGDPWRITLYDEPVDSSNVFLYHKTTRRDVYREAYESARADGFDEAILVNERGEITEGARSNLFIERDGALITPPVGCGLLGGVYREHVLSARSDAEQAVLTPDDLRSADAIHLCNAVRGWVRAHLAVPETVS